MKNSMLITSLFILFSFTSLHAQWWGSKTIQGNGNVITQTIQTANYNGLSVAGNFYVTVVDGREGSITLKGESNLLEEVIVEVKDDVLHIKTENKINLKSSRGKNIEITVPATRLSKVSLAGSGEIKNNFNLKSDDFSVKLAGSGDIKLNLQATELEVKVAGSGDIVLNGIAGNVNGSIAGSGTVDAYRLSAEDVSVTIAGSGDYKANCSGNLKARVSGSGSIQYKGKPTKIDSKVAGSGKIKMVD